MVEIERLRPEQIEAAKDAICACWHEFWGEEGSSPDELRRRAEQESRLEDLDNVRAEYFDNGGLFLAIVDDGRVVGTGALRRFADDICELCRIWILPEYRCRGIGTRLAERLLDFARREGYQTVRLDTVSDLHGAVRFYEGLGFRHIEPYKEVEFSDVFMVKEL